MIARILVGDKKLDIAALRTLMEDADGQEPCFVGKNIWRLDVPVGGVKVKELISWLRANHLGVKEGEMMTFWINGADNLNEQCQNMLLKPLEESRDKVLFVLTVKSESRLLPTIVSRCRVRKLEPARCGLVGEEDVFWKELVQAWKQGPGASIALLDKWGKGNELLILDLFINKLAKGLKAVPSLRRVRILDLALELKRDAGFMVNKRLLLGRFLLEGCKISGLDSSS